MYYISWFLSVCWFQARQTAQQKQQAAEESRKDYVTSLNQFNQDQHQHYHTLVPVIYQVSQQQHSLVPVIYQVNQQHHSLVPVIYQVNQHHSLVPVIYQVNQQYHLSCSTVIHVSTTVYSCLYCMFLCFTAYPGHGGAAD